MIREIRVLAQDPYVQSAVMHTYLTFASPGECAAGTSWLPFIDHVPFHTLVLGSTNGLAGVDAELHAFKKVVSGTFDTTWFFLGPDKQEIQGVPDAQGRIPLLTRQWFTCVVVKGLWNIVDEKVVEESA